MKERIIEFLRAENKSSANFAEEIGVQPSAVSHIVSGRNNPSLDFVLKMLAKYPFLSVEWLLFGRGSMYRDSGMQDLFTAAAYQQNDQANVQPQLTVPDKVRPAEGADSLAEAINPGKVEKIVWFFSDNTFVEYKPSGDS